MKNIGNWLPLLIMSPIIIGVALSIVYWMMLLTQHIQNRWAVRVGARKARQAERERKARIKGHVIYAKDYSLVWDFWNWLWTKLVMISFAFGVAGLGSYYLDKDTFGSMPSLGGPPSWMAPVSWVLTIGSVAIIAIVTILEFIRDDRARNERGTINMLVVLFHLVGVGTMYYGFASHSRSLLWMGVFGGLAIIGSAQWLRVTNRK